MLPKLSGLSCARPRMSSYADLRVGETADQFASNFEAQVGAEQQQTDTQHRPRAVNNSTARPGANLLQLDFHDEAANLREFASNFGSPLWRATVSFPKPVPGLVAHNVRRKSRPLIKP
jgi:hypothetical protein